MANDEHERRDTGEVPGIVRQPVENHINSSTDHLAIWEILMRFGVVDVAYTKSLRDYSTSPPEIEERVITATGTEPGRQIIIKTERLINPSTEVAVLIEDKRGFTEQVRAEKEAMSQALKANRLSFGATDLPTPYQVIYSAQPHKLSTVKRKPLVNISMEDNGVVTLTMLPLFDYTLYNDPQEILRLAKEMQRPPVRRRGHERKIIGAFGHALDQVTIPARQKIWVPAVDPSALAVIAGSMGKPK